jgi:NAD(P)-dependent dehydrogenase (short-subunit alcohol dehydrogenase family)
MSGKTVVVTGATSGIGRETALGLARLGADLALVASDEARGEATRREVKAAGAGRVLLFVADLASLAQVRRLAADLAARLDRIDVLVNDAGAVQASRKRTSDGQELAFTVNHLAPFLLTNLLLPKLKASAPARVVTVASGRSRLSNIHFASELARRLAGTGVTSNSLHPGLVTAGLGGDHPGWFLSALRLHVPLLVPRRRGGRTSLHLAASSAVEGVTGRYFKDSRVVRPPRAALDEVAARRRWKASARLTGLAGARGPLASGARTAILAP